MHSFYHIVSICYRVNRYDPPIGWKPVQTVTLSSLQQYFICLGVPASHIGHCPPSCPFPPCQTAPPTPQPAWQAHRPNCPPSPLSSPPKKPQKTLENRKKPSTDRPHLLCPGNLQHIIQAPALQEETDQYMKTVIAIG